MRSPRRSRKPLANALRTTLPSSDRIGQRRIFLGAARHDFRKAAVVPLASAHIAQREVSTLPRCPQEGEGQTRHSWLMSAANVCAHRGVPKDEARTLIAEQLTRPPNPSHEIEDAVTKAYNEVGTRFKRSGAPIRFGGRAHRTASG